MRLSACAVLVLAACQSSGDDSFPIVPQGDDTPINPAPDAPRMDASSDAPSSIAGRVCLITDLRNLSSGCAATGAAGITVTLGTGSTVTLDDGSFTLMVPSGVTPGTVWRTSAVGLVTSLVRFGGPNLIPMTTEVRYGDLLDANGMTVASGLGAIFGRVVTAGAARPGITASTQPAASYVTHYDGTAVLLWDQDATGTTGVFWVPAAPVGNITVTLAPTTLPPVVVPVEDQTLTFVTFDVP